ncbi:LysR family transcriptional regulator [Paraburkholderia caledonica]|uniref:DNA-binding transcriptional LysR family regulator n=1 Tax=Paraburkholderia caledonica TaxID=134536 RepID=A0AB73IML6_9BURK|nr:DNA-binding transcriptional LysR family regulator [Paraburkholderia caledonica]
MVNFRLIRHLWLFLVVAEEQNFCRAATRLGMSQPPLTEQIQVLEQSLKVKLFERTSRGARLTPAGEAILPEVRKLSELLERVEHSVKEAIEGQSGAVTIGATNAAMIDTLPLLLARMKQERPGITIRIKEMDSADAVPALRSGEVDVVFARLERNLGKNYASLVLSEERLVLALPEDHALVRHDSISLASLSDEAFVMPARHISHAYFDSVIGACLRYGFSPNIQFEVRSMVSQVAFVSCGQGIALIPTSLAMNAPSNVVIRPVEEDLTVTTTAMAWDSHRNLPLVKHVVEVVKTMTSERASNHGSHLMMPTLTYEALAARVANAEVTLLASVESHHQEVETVET